ncbi:MAG: hypothetical protein IPJ54_21050 [Saprospiraceae bacterium]|nr:hypothetical protein [Saprospiraceae bacterium]
MMQLFTIGTSETPIWSEAMFWVPTDNPYKIHTIPTSPNSMVFTGLSGRSDHL